MSPNRRQLWVYFDEYGHQLLQGGTLWKCIDVVGRLRHCQLVRKAKNMTMMRIEKVMYGRHLERTALTGCRRKYSDE